jgi:hypothetical protein
MDLYTVQAIVNGAAVFGVQISSALRQDDATQIVARNVLQTHGTLYYGADDYLNQTYTVYEDIWDLNPFTGVGWTGAEANALEAGVELVSIA